LPASLKSKWGQPARWTTLRTRRTARRRRSGFLAVRGRGLPAASGADRRHHARRCSMSRRARAASARSSGSAANASTSDRRRAFAWRAAASTRASRTAAETGVPSAVSSSSARRASSSGRKVIVAAMDQSVTRNVRHPKVDGSANTQLPPVSDAIRHLLLFRTTHPNVAPGVRSSPPPSPQQVQKHPSAANGRLSVFAGQSHNCHQRPTTTITRGLGPAYRSARAHPFRARVAARRGQVQSHTRSALNVTIARTSIMPDNSDASACSVSALNGVELILSSPWVRRGQYPESSARNGGVLAGPKKPP
jgi:hypothetical protein